MPTWQVIKGKAALYHLQKDCSSTPFKKTALMQTAQPEPATAGEFFVLQYETRHSLPKEHSGLFVHGWPEQSGQRSIVRQGQVPRVRYRLARLQHEPLHLPRGSERWPGPGSPQHPVVTGQE